MHSSGRRPTTCCNMNMASTASTVLSQLTSPHIGHPGVGEGDTVGEGDFVGVGVGVLVGVGVGVGVPEIGRAHV